MEEVTTLFDSDEAEYEYMKEQDAKRRKAEEEKQIEEMARIICGNNRDCRDCGHNSAVRECGCLFYAKRIYEQDYRKQSGWISVEERLPESGEHCLVNCIVKRCDGTLGQYICVGYYAEKFKHLAYGVDDDCVSEYNEENDEYYIAEGWYEVIKNWDDYGFVAIDDFVTHWMPLPEPPKGAQ